MDDDQRAMPEPHMEGAGVDKFADPPVVEYGPMSDEEFKRRLVYFLSEDEQIINLVAKLNHRH